VTLSKRHSALHGELRELQLNWPSRHRDTGILPSSATSPKGSYTSLTDRQRGSLREEKGGEKRKQEKLENLTGKLMQAAN
jgi:hypothetical protein